MRRRQHAWAATEYDRCNLASLAKLIQSRIIEAFQSFQVVGWQWNPSATIPQGQIPRVRDLGPGAWTWDLHNGSMDGILWLKRMGSS